MRQVIPGHMDDPDYLGPSSDLQDDLVAGTPVTQITVSKRAYDAMMGKGPVADGAGIVWEMQERDGVHTLASTNSDGHKHIWVIDLDTLEMRGGGWAGPPPELSYLATWRD